jgi:hypothetical protein
VFLYNQREPNSRKMENPQHVPLGLLNSHMNVPKGARLIDRCPKCGEKPSKYLYKNNNKRHQVRVQCLRTDCKHKYQLFAFRKLHPDGYKKVKLTEPEQYLDRVKVCPGCGCSNVKFYGLNNNDAIQARYKCLNLACKKLFTPFGNSRRKKRNHQEMTTANSHVVDEVECNERTSMNNLQYSTSNDDSPMSHVVIKKNWHYEELTTADSRVVNEVECFERTSMNALQYSTSNVHLPMTHVDNVECFERTLMNGLQYSTWNDHLPMTHVVSKKKWNHEEMTTADSHVVDDVACFERMSMNDLRYSTSNDHSPMTFAVNSSVFAPRVYCAATRNYCGVGARLERLKSWGNPHHEFRIRNAPTANLRDDGQGYYGLSNLTTCDLNPRDPVTAFMPTMVPPNGIPTTWQEDWVYVSPTPTYLTQQEDRLVHNVSTTPIGLQEHHEPTW